MKINSFNALMAASGFIALGNMLVLLLPETLQHAKESDAVIQESHTEEEISPGQATSYKIDLRTSIATLVHDSRFILANKSLCALLFTFFLSSLSNKSVSILFQLASVRFHWSLADVRF